MNSAIHRFSSGCRLFVAAALVFAPLSACERSKPSVDAMPKPESGPALAEGELSPFSFERLPVDEPGLMSLDPREDGWETEHLNEIAGKQLKKLGTAFKNGDFADGAGLDTVFLPEAKCEPLRPSHLSTVFDDGVTAVSRPVHPPESEPPPGAPELQSWRDGISQLIQSAPQTGERHSKFKIIRVEPARGGFETTQLVSLSSRSPDVAWEQNATWRIGWALGVDPAEPKITSIALEEFEEVQTSRGGTWFTDCTAAVFANEPEIATDQFGVGVGSWKERLNDYLLVMQFGHNGIALGDVDGDGLEDIYRCQLGGLPNRLLLGQPDGTLRDHTREAGLDYLDNTRGALLIDVDNDGDQDLVLAAPLQIVVMENDGTGKFEIRTRFNQENTFSLAAADFDLDGDLDLYACAYYADRSVAERLPVPLPPYDAKNGGRNVLLRNDGDWKFSDVTDSIGLGVDNSRFSFSAIWEDYDNDGKIDLYVANDFGHNNLYRNEGDRFRHVTEEAGTANETFGMSASAGDFNRDGWMDFYKASMYSSAGNRVVTQAQFLPAADDTLKSKMLQLAQGNTLFTNDGKGGFRDEGIASGVAMGRWSWGSIFVDFNNDGWEDLFVTNGFITGRQPDDL